MTRATSGAPLPFPRSPTAEQPRAALVGWRRAVLASPGRPGARPTGRCPTRALAELGTRPFGFYVHVPFCTVRCGYCDFNTYTAEELGDRARRLARDVRRGRDRRGPAGAAGARRPRPAGVHGLLRRRYADPARPGRPRRRCSRPIGDEFGLAPDAEVTTEANPDSVAAWDLVALREAGFTRISLRDAVRRGPHVLRHPRPHPRPAARAGRRRLGARRPASTR